MSSKYMKAFDALSSDDNTKQERTERILSSQTASAEQKTRHSTKQNAKIGKPRRRIFSGKRGIALITAATILVSAIAIPVGITIYNNGTLLGAMAKLKDTFVDMEGVAAFGVWNPPDPSSDASPISSVAYLNPSKNSTLMPELNPEETDENGGIISGDWSDEERYDWESDYDWDPTKANVLIAIDEDGKIDEVVYERTNGRGQVRQDVLGNAAMVYVSGGFTYVMYVDDSEWEFWKEINFAQEMLSPSGFACHHEREQTIVIHNATGKVFALKDLIPQVNELSGATNYTMQVDPFQDDTLRVRPMYGNLVPQWYNVIYDETLQKIRYELVLPMEIMESYYYAYNVCAVRHDKYGQQYVLENYSEYPRVSAGIVPLPAYTRYGNTLLFSKPNGMMLGTDGRMYAFDDGKLKVFGENFVLSPVEAGTEVAFEGISHEFDLSTQGNHGIVYKLKDGYLYSMFGEVWSVGDDGSLQDYMRLKGSFPRYADEGYLMGGELIAFVDATTSGYYSINGKMVKIEFDNTDEPRATFTHIIDASEMRVRNHRMVVEQNQNPLTSTRGETKHFLITVTDGIPNVNFFAYGYDGGVKGLTKPITEPLKLN